MLLPSPRNSLEGQLNLFKVTDCKTLFTTKDYKLPQGLAENTAVPIIHAPSLKEMLVGDEPRKYPFTKSWEEAKSDPILVLHTSGSTGLPKPITFSHYCMSVVDRTRLHPPSNGYGPMSLVWVNKRILSTLPPFHVGVSQLENVRCGYLQEFRLQDLPPVSAIQFSRIAYRYGGRAIEYQAQVSLRKCSIRSTLM